MGARTRESGTGHCSPGEVERVRQVVRARLVCPLITLILIPKCICRSNETWAKNTRTGSDPIQYLPQVRVWMRVRGPPYDFSNACLSADMALSLFIRQFKELRNNYLQKKTRSQTQTPRCGHVIDTLRSESPKHKHTINWLDNSTTTPCANLCTTDHNAPPLPPSQNQRSIVYSLFQVDTHTT